MGVRMGGQREKDSPMLICNKPPEPRGYNPKRLQRLAQPKWTPKPLEEQDEQAKWKPMRPADLSIMEIDLRMRTRRGGVSKAAKNATATERIVHLALPKMESPLFLGGREVETVVTSAAKSAVCSTRTEELLERPLLHRKQQSRAPNHNSHKICTKISGER